jgi:hypothetical protein
MLECQPSLRHTCEWIIMRMVLKKIDVIDELWSIFDQVNLIRRNVFQVKMSGLIYKVRSPLLNSHLYLSYHRRFHTNQTSF